MDCSIDEQIHLKSIVRVPVVEPGLPSPIRERVLRLDHGPAFAESATQQLANVALDVHVEVAALQPRFQVPAKVPTPFLRQTLRW